MSRYQTPSTSLYYLELSGFLSCVDAEGCRKPCHFDYGKFDMSKDPGCFEFQAWCVVSSELLVAIACRMLIACEGVDLSQLCRYNGSARMQVTSRVLQVKVSYSALSKALSSQQVIWGSLINPAQLNIRFRTCDLDPNSETV